MSQSTIVPLSGDWGRDWVFEAKGKFYGQHDRRGLYSVRHPWEESQSGDYARVCRELVIPADWQGPVLLSFFVSDDHHGEDYSPTDWPYYVGADIFVGHRFKQVLVDGEVVWERDVSDDEAPWRRNAQGFPYQGFYQVVDITDRAKPGQTVRLALSVLDKVGSGTALPGDVHHASFWQRADLDAAQLNKWFQFSAWWGDVLLVSREDHLQTRSTFDQRISLKPCASDNRSAERGAPDVVRVELPVRRAECLPDMPYPLWGGVPFPRGLLRDSDQIRLMNEDGTEAPCQVQVCSRWAEDASIQWTWISTLARPGQEKFIMECGPQVSRAPSVTSLAVNAGDDGVVVDTGAIKIRAGAVGGHSLIQSFQLPGVPECGPVVGVLNQQMLGEVRRHLARPASVTLEETGPVRVSVRIEGELVDEQGHQFGPFVARLWAWAGSPLVSLSFRIFQQTDQLVAMVDSLLLEVATPFEGETLGGFSASTFDRPLPKGQVRELELRQAGPESYVVRGRRSERIEEGEHAPGWVNTRGLSQTGSPGGLACGVRWFWQQCPKSLTVTPDRVMLGLFQRRPLDDWNLDSPIYMMTQGEAKRHQVWLLPHDGQAPAALLEQVQRAWDARPQLMNGEWIASTGVLGHFAQHSETKFPEMDRVIQSWDSSELGQVRYGIRDFRETAWCQNYRGRAANGLVEYFASGRPQWQEYFEQVMAHNLDVDTIHFDPDHPEWLGALRAYSPYHTTGESAEPIGSNCQDQFLHYFFAGEPDSLQDAMAAADYIARMPSDQGRSAREEGWPLAQIAMGFLWTANERYRRAAEGFLEVVRLYTHPRRGAFVEMHETFSHRGIVPFMSGYLGYGLIRYHQATGDERAAKLLVALSEAAVSEMGDGRGGFGYSPGPHAGSNRGEYSSHWSVSIGGMLAYSYRLTCDPWFAQQAKACYDRIVSEGHISLDHAPLMGEMLSGIEAAEACGDLTA